MSRFVIACGEMAEDAPLPGTRVFPCVRVDRAALPDAPLSWRARAMLDGQLETLDIASLPSPGAVGCALSHIRLWQQLVASGEERFVIFEEDAHVRDVEAVERALREAPEYDVLLLGWRLPVDTLLHRRYERLDDGRYSLLVAPRFYETHAYAITRRAAEALLREALPVEMQIDAYMAVQRVRLGLRFVVCKDRAARVRQSRAIWQSTVQTDVMRQCAVCRLPAPVRSGWALLVLVIGAAAVVVLLARRQRTAPNMASW